MISTTVEIYEGPLTMTPYFRQIRSTTVEIYEGPLTRIFQIELLIYNSRNL